jgi:hypothetical protein
VTTVILDRARAVSALMPAMSMRRALGDPRLLGDVLSGPSWAAWRTLLIALMGEPLDDAEREVFPRLTDRHREPLARVEEFWGLVGRRGGKSRGMACLIVYLSSLCNYRSVTSIGEKPTVLCLAQNAKQAGVVFGYVAGITEATPMLAKLIRNKTSEVLSLTNGVEIEIRAASFRGLRGTSAVAVVCDEICFWYSDDSASANPDGAILDAIRPSLAATGGPLICISSPYARRGEAYDCWKKNYCEQGDPSILVAVRDSRSLNPSLSQKVIDRAYERDPIAAASEYGALWRSDIQDFLGLDTVMACVMPGVTELPPSLLNSYVAFVDCAGGSGADSMSLAISYLDGDIARLALCKEFAPPFSPESVVADFAFLLRRYNVSTVTGDSWGGDFVQERFRRAGISYKQSDKTKSAIYVSMLPLINSQRMSLLDDKRLIAQLTSLERRTARQGRDSIDHPPNMHDDLVNSAAGSLVLAAGRDRRATFCFG